MPSLYAIEFTNYYNLVLFFALTYFGASAVSFPCPAWMYSSGFCNWLLAKIVCCNSWHLNNVKVLACPYAKFNQQPFPCSYSPSQCYRDKMMCLWSYYYLLRLATKHHNLGHVNDTYYSFHMVINWILQLQMGSY